MQCYFDYIYDSITSFRKRIFLEVIASIDGGDVLDLGCGQVGHYWALGYAHKAKSLSFYDYSAVNIAEQQRVIDMVSPASLEEQFTDTLAFLKESKLLPSELTYTEIAQMLINKTEECKQFNFLEGTSNRTFDHIVAIESLECVDTEDDFIHSMGAAMKLLKPRGHLAMVALTYDTQEAYIDDLIASQLEGALNPNRTIFERIMHSVPHDRYTVSDIRNTKLVNYSTGFIAHIYA